MSKMKKMLALIASLSIAMTSLAVIPAQADVADGVTTIIEEDFSSDELKGTVGEDGDVYTENGVLNFKDGDKSASVAKAKYTVDLGKKTSGMVSISFDMNLLRSANLKFKVLCTTGNFEIAELAMFKAFNYWRLDNVVSGYNYGGQYTGTASYAMQLAGKNLVAENASYTIDMLLDLDNWTVQSYVNNTLIFNGKLSMNTQYGTSSTTKVAYNANKFVIDATGMGATNELTIDNLKIYHYQDEWSKPVKGKEKRVLVSDNFEMPAGRPTHEYNVEKEAVAVNQTAVANKYVDGVLTRGFEVVDDPTNPDNKVLKFVHDGNSWSPVARYQLGKVIYKKSEKATDGSLEVTAGQVEVSYKIYTDIKDVFFRANGTDFKDYSGFRNFMHPEGYVMGRYPANTEDTDIEEKFVEAKIGAWHDVRMVIDLDNKKISYYLDDLLRIADADFTVVNPETEGYTDRYPFDKGLKVFDFANCAVTGTAYIDDVRVAVLEDVAVTNKRIKTSEAAKAGTISTVEGFMAKENPNYEVTVYNSTDTAADMMLVMAVYNSDGRVEKVDLVQAEAAAIVTDETAGTVQGKTTRITTGFSDEFRAAVAQGKTIKLFVWDGVDTLTPITDAKTVT